MPRYSPGWAATKIRCMNASLPGNSSICIRVNVPCRPMCNYVQQRQAMENEPDKEKMFECGAGIRTAHVDPQGRLHPCMLWRAPGPYDFLNRPLEEGWEQHNPATAGNARAQWRLLLLRSSFILRPLSRDIRPGNARCRKKHTLLSAKSKRNGRKTLKKEA